MRSLKQLAETWSRETDATQVGNIIKFTEAVYDSRLPSPDIRHCM